MSGFSCREKGDKYISQGEIHYNIEYKGNFGIATDFLPQDLIVSFKRDKILFEMIGLGNSGIVNLTNPEKGIYDTYFSLFVKKYYYAAAANEPFPGLEAMKGMEIKKTSRTKVICGFNCKNAEVRFPSDFNKVHEIWYTTEIKIKNPNASTPFKQIDGVLMSFFFIMGPSELHFLAETVYKKDIPDNFFNRKPDYILVTRENIIEIMSGMLSI
jgi:hypothetical protein